MKIKCLGDVCVCSIFDKVSKEWSPFAQFANKDEAIRWFSSLIKRGYDDKQTNVTDWRLYSHFWYDSKNPRKRNDDYAMIASGADCWTLIEDESKSKEVK